MFSSISTAIALNAIGEFFDSMFRHGLWRTLSTPFQGIGPIEVNSKRDFWGLHFVSRRGVGTRS
jgi:hypothetical protein